MPFPFCCFPSSSSSRHRKSSSPASFKRSTFQAATKNLTKIFEELKCPVCFNICVPPIHNCVNGHIICNTCRLKGHVTNCPTCRQSLSSGARNMFAENFVLNYAQQCFYASQGCEHLRLKGCSMKSHEDKCMFRPIKCIVGTCGLNIPYKNFLAHLDCGHKASGSDRLPTQIQFKYNPKKKGARKWLPYYIQAFDNVYYVMMKRLDKVFWVWVYSQLAKESDDIEYSYSALIKLRHPEKKISVSWHGPVYSIRTPFKSILSEGCAFTLSSTLIKSFCAGGNLNFCVDIKKTARRTLKGLDVPLEGDSETTVVSSGGGLPQEYNRPPSFYEPNILSSQPSPAVQDYRGPTPPLPHQGNNQGTITDSEENRASVQNHHQIHGPYPPLSIESATMFHLKAQNLQTTTQAPPPPPPKRRILRTAAIGIPSFVSPSSPQPCHSPAMTSFLDTIPPPGETHINANNTNNNNDEGGDGDDDGFGDKIAVMTCASTSDLQKNFFYNDYPSN